MSGRGLLDILVDFEGTRFGLSFILDTPLCFAISFFLVSSGIKFPQANVSPYRGSGVTTLPFSLRNLDLVTCSSFAMLLDLMVTILYEQTSRPAIFAFCHSFDVIVGSGPRLLSSSTLS